MESLQGKNEELRREESLTGQGGPTIRARTKKKNRSCLTKRSTPTSLGLN